MGAVCATRRRVREALPLGSSSSSGAGNAGGAFVQWLRHILSSPPAALAELKNDTTEPLVLLRRNREVWKGPIIELGPKESKSIPADHQLLDGGGETFEFLEVLVGRGIRPIPPIRIDPWELLHYKQLVLRGDGDRLSIDKIP